MGIKQNDVTFCTGRGVVASDFRFGEGGFHAGWSRPPGPPGPLKPSALESDEVIRNPSGSLTIRVNCVRIGNEPAAAWFCGTVGNDPSKMLGLATRDERPKELNLSYGGKLIVNGVEYEITLGQGHHGVNNPWWVAAPTLHVVNRKAPKAMFGNDFWIEEAIHDAVMDFRISLR